MLKSMEFSLKNEEELPQISEILWSKFEHKVILFVGELGAGKTTLIKSLIRTKNEHELASSPSFSLINEYNLSTNLESPEHLYHMDLYRLEDQDEIYNIGVLEYIDSGNWVFIEWPQIIAGLVPANHHKIEITVLENWTRKIIFN